MRIPDVYTRQLCQLAAAIQEKRRRRTEVCLLHDNARPHVASATRQQLEELGWTTVPHPPYSPDLAPSDFHLSRSLKNYPRDQSIRNFDHLKSGLTGFFERQPADFWERAIQALSERWRHEINLHG